MATFVGKEKIIEIASRGSRLSKSPLHVRVRESLREMVEDHFQDGEQFFSESVLIGRLGVSQGTIRRALGDLAREGLLVRKAPVGTFVRKLPVQTFIVEVFTPDYKSPFSAALLDQIAMQCRQRRCALRVRLTHQCEDIETLLAQFEPLPSEARVILLGNPPSTTRQLHFALDKRGYQMVNVDTWMRGYEGAYVGVDNAEGIRLGVEHLRQLGHRRIVLLVNEPMEYEGVLARCRAFQTITAEWGLNDCLVVDCGTKSGESGYNKAYRKMDQILEMRLRPTAVFAVSDQGAWAVLKRLAEQGINVPSQTSVLGLDDDRTSRFTHPALSTIAQPITDIGRRAVEMLEERRAESRMELLRPSLVVRESTGLVPSE